MKPDTAKHRPASVDLDVPAHLREPDDRSHQIWRYDPDPALAELVNRFWIPVWSVPPGEVATQRLLQYPVALTIVDARDARFAGVSSGLSTVTLEGDGWAVGTLFRPAAGGLLTGGSMAGWTDREAPLAEVLGAAAAPAVDAVRTAMADAPTSERTHRAAVAALEKLLAPFAPVDEEGRLVNRIVATVEDDPTLVQVGQLCERLGLSERSIQRLTQRRLGLTPKWLIARRRLHEATDALRRGDETVAAVAARLGYADQSHLTRDLRAVTDLTPTQLAAAFAHPDPTPAR